MPLFGNSEQRQMNRRTNRSIRRSDRQYARQARWDARGQRQAARQSMIQNIAGKAADTYALSKAPVAGLLTGLDNYGDQEPINTTQQAGVGNWGVLLIGLLLVGALMKKK